MKINEILSTEDRVKLLAEIIGDTGPLSVSKVAKKTRLSKGFVSKYLNLLVSQRVLTKRGTKFFTRDNNNVKSLRLLLMLDTLDERIFNRYKNVDSVGLYGSSTKGENTNDSDVDLWIKVGKEDQEEIGLLSSRLKQRFGDVNLLVLTDEKIKKLREKDPMFYHSLFFGSINIHGKNAL